MSDLVPDLHLLHRIGASYFARRVAGQAAAEIERLTARLAEAERDAARYRWLVTCNDGAVWSFLSGMDDDQIDEQIDAWRAGSADAGRKENSNG